MRLLAVLACACLPLAAGVFEGRVREDHNGNPLPRVEIQITRPGAEAAIAELETDGQGRFRTPELEDAAYTIRFSKTNFSTVAVTIPPRQGMQIRLVHFGAIAGRVYGADGSPVAIDWHSIFATTLDGNKAGTGDRNARQGEYRIYGLAPGRYRLAVTEVASKDTYTGQGILFQPDNTHPREFTIAGGEEYSNVDIHLPPAAVYKITGKVEMAAPADYHVVVVAADFPSLAFGGSAGGSGYTAFSIGELLPGNYELLGQSTTGDGRRFGRVPISLTGGNVENVVLAINQSRSVQLVLKAAAQCRSSVAVELTAAESSDIWWRLGKPQTTLQADKPATLDRLPPSKFAISAKPAEGDCFAIAPASIDLRRESASKPVEVLLQPAGAIHGRIAGTGSRVAVLIAPDGAQQIAFPDEKGEVVFAHLRPGNYSLVAAGAETRWMPAADSTLPTVRVSSGTITEAELQ